MTGLSKSCRSVRLYAGTLCRTVNNIDMIGDQHKLFAGGRLRRLRLQRAVTQTRMADDLGVSVSYLNLIERNQRPLTAAFLLKLANAYDLDLRQLTGDDGIAVTAELADLFADPRLAGLDVSRAELAEVAASAPGVAQALLRLGAGGGPALETKAAGPVEAMTELLLERRNHFPDLDAAAEALADDLRLTSGDLAAGLAERLRARHGIAVRILPATVLPDLLRRLDLHSRQLQLSEGLDAASRTFAIAYQLALIELKPAIDAVVAGANLPSKAHERFAVQTLANYAAAATMMPYARFHTAAEALGYDLELLQARFGAGFEQVAHRLTTLARPGMRGIPFLMIRTDRAGNISKRFSAVRSALAADGGGCPLVGAPRRVRPPGADHAPGRRDRGRAALPVGCPHGAHLCDAVRHGEARIRHSSRRRPFAGGRDDLRRRPRYGAGRGDPDRARLCPLRPRRVPPAEPRSGGRAADGRRAHPGADPVPI